MAFATCSVVVMVAMISGMIHSQHPMFLSLYLTHIFHMRLLSQKWKIIFLSSQLCEDMASGWLKTHWLILLLGCYGVFLKLTLPSFNKLCKVMMISAVVHTERICNRSDMEKKHVYPTPKDRDKAEENTKRPWGSFICGHMRKIGGRNLTHHR